MSSFLRTFAIFAALCGVLVFVFRDELAKALNWPTFQSSRLVGVDPESLTTVYQRLNIAPLNSDLLANEKIGRALRDLTISFCDKTAIYRLGKGLAQQGERKPAATALLAFADACPNSEGERYMAANFLYGIGDYAGVLLIANRLVEMRPEVGQYYYTRGQALSALGRHEDAITDFTSALALVDDLQRVSSGVFSGLASAYAETGRHCQAMTAIQTFVHADALKRDTATTRKLITEYASKGNCRQGYARGNAVIPRTRSDVTLVQATVNGVKGLFVLDTGASLVALAPGFAGKLRTEPSSIDRSLVLHTANGVTRAKLTTLDAIEVDGVRAEKVSAAILAQPIGPGVDGLLGMSFLARFDVALGSKAVHIKERNDISKAAIAK